jgi:Haem-degrading
MMYAGSRIARLVLALAAFLVLLLPAPSLGQEATFGCQNIYDAIPDAVQAGDLHTTLENTMDTSAVGLQNDMWGTIVDKFGFVCAVAKTGASATGSQWLGSRVISAQKANTANLFSLTSGAGGLIPGLALSTANLWAATQPGGSLFGLQLSNPVATDVAYGPPLEVADYGTDGDPMNGKLIGGINVFGGGLALYDDDGNLLGGLGMSGDTSCADHVKAWKTRDALGLDHVPDGVAGGTDNIIFDIQDNAPIKNNGGQTVHRQPNLTKTVSAGGFGHPTCGLGEETAANALPVSNPIG